MSNNRQGFIAVHVAQLLLLGAGQHSETLKDKYQIVCREACKKGCESLRLGRSVLDAVVEATILLENSPLTNAGFGSNLTYNGTVECDASVMDGSNLHFGAVGAVSGIKNPIALAKQLCEHQSFTFAYGRVPPSFLVGNGARIWAEEMGIETLAPEELISPKAQKVYKHYKRKVEDSTIEGHMETYKHAKKRLDTVGAICIDADGNVASTCSSGGIILKYPGRVGQAGIWGCGTWSFKNNYSVGTSTSGCGEHLVRTTLARTVAESIVDAPCPTTKLHQTMKSEFIESHFLDGLEQKLGGVIAVRYSANDKLGDFLWSHSTNSMIVGCMNTTERSSVSYVSVLPSNEVGKKAVVGGICFKLTSDPKDTQ